MSAFDSANKNVLDYEYSGYVVRAKNTFIDVTPKASKIRSRSFDASISFDDLHGSESKNSFLDVKAAHDFQSTTASSNSDGGDQDQPASQASQRGDAVDSSLASDEFVVEQFQKYLVDTDNSGLTLMWHGLPTKYHMKPDLLRIFETIDAQGVEYLYLPLNHWEKSRVTCGKCRNKGYAFVHFKTVHDADDFTKKIADYTIESRRSTATTLAAHQGISLNLFQLVTAPQKRTASGTIFLKSAEDTFECVTISSLRKLHKAMMDGLQQ
jgi:hypothetical protein